MNEIIGYVVLTLFPLCMVFSAIYDVFTLKIPNIIILILLGSFFIFAFYGGMTWQTMGFHFGVALAVFIPAFLVYAFGDFGAGDVKLLGASTLWLGPSLTLPYLFATGLLGGVLAVVIFMLRHHKLIAPLADFLPIPAHFLDKNKGIPYGAAMGPAAIWAFMQSPWMGFISSGAFTAAGS